jgi:GTP-binding protein YchF
VKEVGLVGLPHSGKSTLFTALTRSGSPGRSNQAVVEVPDERVETLAGIERSRKSVHAKVTFVDVPGALSARGIARHREADALCLVLGVFAGGLDAGKELVEITAELLVSDLASLEGALTRARKRARGAAEERAELEVLERAHAVLDSERPLNREKLSAAELKILKGFGLLTLKPWVVVANVRESDSNAPMLPEGSVVISAALEAEVAGLDAAEAEELLASVGVEQPSLRRVIAACYRALDLITFLTTGPDETRAWEVARGATAAEAAGVIHSDLERGFVRAEVIAYDDLLRFGSWEAAKSRGMIRVEGRSYLVQEGDVLRVRFAV